MILPSELSALAASCRTVQWRGKSYRLSPLRDKDYGEVEAWLQDRCLDLALRNLRKLEDRADKDALIKAAHERASRMTLQSPESESIIDTVPGAAFLVWLMLRQEHPDVTQDLTLELCTDAEVLYSVMMKVETLNSSPRELPVAAASRGPINREELYCRLARAYNWTPAQIAELTPYQQRVFLAGAEEDGLPDGCGRLVKVNTREEADALVRRLRGERLSA